MALLNQITIKGRLFTGHQKEFDGQDFNGNDIKTVFTQIMIPQYVGKDKGYNGSGYDNKFYNLEYKKTNLELKDKDQIIVVGSLKQTTDKGNRSLTSIVATNIFVVNEPQIIATQGTENYGTYVSPESIDVEKDAIFFEE